MGPPGKCIQMQSRTRMNAYVHMLCYQLKRLTRHSTRFQDAMTSDDGWESSISLRTDLLSISRALCLVAAVAFRRVMADTTAADDAAESEDIFAIVRSSVNGLASEIEVPTVFKKLANEDGAASASMPLLAEVRSDSVNCKEAEAAALLLADEAPAVLAERLETLTLMCKVLQVKYMYG